MTGVAAVTARARRGWWLGKRHASRPQRRGKRDAAREERRRACVCEHIKCSSACGCTGAGAMTYEYLMWCNHVSIPHVSIPRVPEQKTVHEVENVLEKGMLDLDKALDSPLEVRCLLVLPACPACCRHRPRATLSAQPSCARLVATVVAPTRQAAHL